MINSGVRFTVKSIQTDNQIYRDLVYEYTGKNLATLSVRNKVIFNHVAFTTNDDLYTQFKFNKYCVFDNLTNNYGMIKSFIDIDDIVYVILEKFYKYDEDQDDYEDFLFDSEYPQIISKMNLYRLSNSYFITQIHLINHVFFYEFSNNYFLISSLSTRHLFK